ncbi:Attractin-like protein 1 [Chelonia mydas]|uniref:Attractin-like protein 1 n=1 Tax=Chelonia mydas TaxID=8469 RepID=M7C3M1_CHEMY|nr:Attractin-like protein 1 [Chelonia mydas]
MYVYDGDSVYAPLIAVFSGLIVPEVRGNETVPEVVTTSGYVLLHFFSDAAYNLTGFNIFYSINSCPNNCSGHGKCTTSVSIPSQVYCECDKYWKGEACDIPYCKANCGSPDHGYCDLTGEKLCVCNDSWQVKNVLKFFAETESSYNLDSNIWNVVPVSKGPLQRYGHSLALYQEDIYMYGGKVETNNGNVTDELWIFSINSQTWSTKIPAVLIHGQQYAVEGHSAHIVELDSRDVVMIIIFGYSAVYGYTSSVQEYYIRSNSWLVPETKGAIVQGGYGHSSVYDAMTKSIYVHGGYKALPGNKYGLVDDLYRYEVNTRTWHPPYCLLRTLYQRLLPLRASLSPDEELVLQATTPDEELPLQATLRTILKESGFAKYLHSAVLISGALLIFGGNTHNDTSLSNGAKCFSADFLAYDIVNLDEQLLVQPKHLLETEDCVRNSWKRYCIVAQQQLLGFVADGAVGLIAVIRLLGAPDRPG